MNLTVINIPPLTSILLRCNCVYVYVCVCLCECVYLYPSIATLCPSAPVRCAPLASPVDDFAESVYPVSNYASPANKQKKSLKEKETLSPVIFEKIGGPHCNSVFNMVLGLWNDSAIWLTRF